MTAAIYPSFPRHQQHLPIQIALMKTYLQNIKHSYGFVSTVTYIYA